MNIRNRVKELRNVPASSLRPNAANWRTHPENQKGALQGLLADVGFAVPIVARELPDGTLQILDGHLRADTVGDVVVPVVVLDVSEAEAAKLLATIDPLSALAGQDDSKLMQLLANVQSDSAAVQEMLGALVKVDVPGELPAPLEMPAPSYQVLIECFTEQHQAELLTELTTRGLKVKSLIG